MLNCILCKPLNTLLQHLYLVASKRVCRSKKRKICSNKKHKKNRAQPPQPPTFENVEPISTTKNNSEFVKRYKSLTKYNKELSLKNEESFLKYSDANNINKILESIKYLVWYMELYGNQLEEYGKKLNTTVNDNEGSVNSESDKKNKFKKNVDTYNYLNVDYPCLPKKQAISVLYKLCQALENVLPYVGFIALNVWKRHGRDKLKRMYTIYLYLLYARKELITLTEYYVNNEDFSLVKRKTKSLWWALDSAKKQLDSFRKRSGANNIKTRLNSYRKSKYYLDRKESMFNLVRNCCLYGNNLNNHNTLRKSNTNENVSYLSRKILEAFKIDEKTFIRKSDST